MFTHEEEAIARVQASATKPTGKPPRGPTSTPAVVMPIMGNLNNITYALTAMFGGHLVVVLGNFEIGSLAAFLQYSRQVGMPVQTITNQLNNILAAMAGAERVFEVMDQQPESRRGDGHAGGCGQERGRRAGDRAPTDGTASHWAWKMPQPERRVPATSSCKATCASTMSLSAMSRKRPCCATSRCIAKPGAEDRPGRLDRGRQDHDHQPDQPLLRDR